MIIEKIPENPENNGKLLSKDGDVITHEYM